VEISANLSKNMRDGRSRQKIVPPSRLPKGYVMNQQVEILHSAETINAGLQAAQSAMNQTSAAAIGELKETEAKNDALNALGKTITQYSENNGQCKSAVIDMMGDLLRMQDQVTALAASLPTAQKQVEAASQESEAFGDDASSGATENVRDATRSGGT
jgi:uncharacterized protein involved in exopolysaccharide biosynthesis